MIFRINLLSPILVLLLLAVLPASPVSAQRQKKTDKLLLTNLDTHIRYLSGEREGKSGVPGEKQARDYIASEFSKTGLQPRGDNGGWLQTFGIDQGRVVGGDAYFIVNDQPLVLNKEYFPLAFSAVGTVSGSPAIALQESGVPWFFDLRDLMESQDGAKSNLPRAIRAKAAAFAKKGATALIVYNTSRTADNLTFDGRDKSEPAAIPIIYITAAAKRKYLRDESASVEIRLKTGFAEKTSTGHNVVGFIDNGASSTVMIGAHYDQFGAGGDSLSTGGVHNADNAMGVAAMIELARMLASSKLKNNNYLFVAFSRGEQGSSGSEYMSEHPAVDLQRMNYMLDLDRTAPPQDSSYALILGGYGSSPGWWGACRGAGKMITFPIRVDTSYARPGDQTFFYEKEVPVMVFYFGADNAEHTQELAIVKYIFEMVKTANTSAKLKFTPITTNGPSVEPPKATPGS